MSFRNSFLSCTFWPFSQNSDSFQIKIDAAVSFKSLFIIGFAIFNNTVNNNNINNLRGVIIFIDL